MPFSAHTRGPSFPIRVDRPGLHPQRLPRWGLGEDTSLGFYVARRLCTGAIAAISSAPVPSRESITGHNHLLEWYRGTDGIKTGYTHGSSLNLAASAERNGHRLIGVILGSPSWRLRDKQMAYLLDGGFAEIGSATLARADPVLPAARKPSGIKARTGLAAYVPPVAEAKAAPITEPKAYFPRRRRPASVPASENFGIQLGAFHTGKAATKRAHVAGDLAVAEGKPVRVLKPDKRSRNQLCRVQLLGFTERGAQRTCARIEKKIPCFVVMTAAKS